MLGKYVKIPGNYGEARERVLNGYKRHLRTIWLILYLGGILPAVATPKYPGPPGHDLRLPAHWGAYTITRKDQKDRTLICICDRHDKIVRAIDYGDCSAIYTQQINPKGVPDLMIVAWNGSNVYCSHTTYIFSQAPHVRNVAIITGGEGNFVRLGKHGLQFVMTSSGVLEWACDVCHACEPSMPVVLDWHNGWTTDAARRYPALFQAAARGYRSDFLAACAKARSSRPPQSTEGVISPAAGYYASEYELGHGTATYRWIMRHLPSAITRQWFHDCATIVRYQIAQIKHMTSVSQAAILTVPDGNVFTNPPHEPE